MQFLTIVKDLLEAEVEVEVVGVVVVEVEADFKKLNNKRLKGEDLSSTSIWGCQTLSSPKSEGDIKQEKTCFCRPLRSPSLSKFNLNIVVICENVEKPHCLARLFNGVAARMKLSSVSSRS